MVAFISMVYCKEIPEGNSVDSDQTSPFAASELGLHFLHDILKRESGLKGLILTTYIVSQINKNVRITLS